MRRTREMARAGIEPANTTIFSRVADCNRRASAASGGHDPLQTEHLALGGRLAVERACAPACAPWCVRAFVATILVAELSADEGLVQARAAVFGGECDPGYLARAEAGERGLGRRMRVTS